MKQIEFELNKSTRIYHISMTGTVGNSEFLESWGEILMENSSSAVLGCIINCNNANFELLIDDLDTISKFFMNNRLFFHHKRIAFVTSKPEQVVLPMLLEDEIKICEIKPFSTKTAAHNWLKERETYFI